MELTYLFRFQHDIHIFPQYEQIESINIQFENDVILCGLIQYTNSKIVENLVGRGRFFIRDIIEYKVKPMSELKDDQHTNVDMIEHFTDLKLIEENVEDSFKQDTQNNILTVLNDDCLREIFRKIDKLSDFHSIANVCTQFNRIAKEVFPSKIKYAYIYFFNIMHYEEGVTLSQIENFLNNFGSSIHSLQIRHSFFEKLPDASNSFFKLIYKHCKNLRELCIQGQSFTKEFILDVFPILPQLRSLDVNLTCESDLDLFNDCFVRCTHLETLQITGCNENNPYTLPAITFSNLINFEVGSTDISYHEFLKQNPQIEDLDIEYAVNTCKTIAEKMTKIRKLHIFFRGNQLTEIDNVYLRHLKHVDLDMTLELNDSLRNLYIFPLKNVRKLWLHAYADCNQNHLIDLTKNLPDLKELTVECNEYRNIQPTNNITMTTLKEMLQCANQLSELSIFCTYNYIYHFDEKDYYDMLEIIKKRDDNIKLNINIRSYATKIVHSEFDPSTSIKRLKHIRLNMVPKWLTVSIIYEYHRWGN